MPLDLADVDLIVSSSHKWILATHGGGLVGVPQPVVHRWPLPAGSWFHLQDAFGAIDSNARSANRDGDFAVGMPNFPAIHAIRRPWNTCAASASRRSTPPPSRW